MVQIQDDLTVVVHYHRRDYQEVADLLRKVGIFDAVYHSPSNILAIANGRDGSHGLLVARTGQIIIGCLIVTSCGPEVVELRYLAIDPAVSQRETARRLIEDARARFGRRKAKVRAIPLEGQADLYPRDLLTRA